MKTYGQYCPVAHALDQIGAQAVISAPPDGHTLFFASQSTVAIDPHLHKTMPFDPVRDFTLVDNTPIDYLDFASPVSGLGSKVGIDATSKWPGETTREWGRPIAMTAAVKARVDALWAELGLG